MSSLIPDVPRVALATFPSPLDRATRLEKRLREEGAAAVPRIYIKRDDQLSLALGGNKIRNLEFLIGQALAEGATDIVTAGRQQSNHCRLTAAACALAGLRCHLVVNGKPPDVEAGNLRLMRILGARIYFTLSEDRTMRETWVRVAGEMPGMLGGIAYVIPVGGSDARGALGHVLLAEEIVSQCKALGETPAAIVLATATGGTQAGLIAGLRKLHVPARVLGYTVAGTADELRAKIADVVAELEHGIGVANGRESVIHLDDGYIGAGYGQPTEAAAAAIELLASSEAIVADPVYTGKALAGLVASINAGAYSSDEAVVFVHTGGTPALFV